MCSLGKWGLLRIACVKVCRGPQCPNAPTAFCNSQYSLRSRRPSSLHPVIIQWFATVRRRSSSSHCMLRILKYISIPHFYFENIINVHFAWSGAVVRYYFIFLETPDSSSDIGWSHWEALLSSRVILVDEKVQVCDASDAEGRKEEGQWRVLLRRQLQGISFLHITYLLWQIQKLLPLIHRLFKFGTRPLTEFLVHIVLHSWSNNLGLPAKHFNHSLPLYLIYL